MKTIKQTYLINAPVEKVWQALVDPKVIDAWGGGPSIMSDEKGFKFKFWGGDIYGENIQVQTKKKLLQDWKYAAWKEFSRVTFNLASEGNKTKLELVHENVPDSEFENINQGWKDYYLGPLKKLVEKI